MTKQYYHWDDYSEFENDRGGLILEHRYEIKDGVVTATARDPNTSYGDEPTFGSIEDVKTAMRERISALAKELYEATEFANALNEVGLKFQSTPDERES
jgi:hypothetical protein